MRHGFSFLPRMPETRQRARWSLGAAAVILALFGWMVAESVLGVRERPIWLVAVYAMLLALNAYQ
ncbi:MAG: hypothetical protein WBF53_06215, partial [Litorimonas sp.]